MSVSHVIHDNTYLYAERRTTVIGNDVNSVDQSLARLRGGVGQLLTDRVRAGHAFGAVLSSFLLTNQP